MKNHNLKPFVKWVGGKRQLLKNIEKLLPESFNTYFEPFLGGGAVLFHIQPKKAVINDLNEGLIDCYASIKYNRLSLTDQLKSCKNTKEMFYKVRCLDRNERTFNILTSTAKAARFIYLNKTCFNGLYRVNSKGQFNSPFGYCDNPKIVDTETLNAVNTYLNNNDITTNCGSFEVSLKSAQKDDFVYFDPPYDVPEGAKNFTAYTKGGFNRGDQKHLKSVCDNLTKKGVKFLLSNSATDFILDLYKDYDVNQVLAKRSINSDGSKRGKVKELLIKNY